MKRPVCYDRWMNKETSRSEDSAWDRARDEAPHVDSWHLPVDDPMREVYVGLTLGGFRVTEISERGNGADAYPFITLEANIEKEAHERYEQLLRKKDEMKDLLSDPEKQFLEEMRTHIEEMRDLLNRKLSTLLDEYYDAHGEHEAIGRLVAVRNEDGINVILPNGVPESGVIDKREYSEDEQKERSEIFSTEIQNFGDFLRNKAVS